MQNAPMPLKQYSRKDIGVIGKTGTGPQRGITLAVFTSRSKRIAVTVTVIILLPMQSNCDGAHLTVGIVQRSVVNMMTLAGELSTTLPIMQSVIGSISSATCRCNFKINRDQTLMILLLIKSASNANTTGHPLENQIGSLSVLPTGDHGKIRLFRMDSTDAETRKSLFVESKLESKRIRVITMILH